MTVRKPIVIVDGEKRELPAGDTLHGVKHVRYYNVYTDSEGAWSVDYTGDFSQVDWVDPRAIHNVTEVGEQKTATLAKYDNDAANGYVVESKVIIAILVGGAEGLEFSEAGVLVRVRVEGAPP